MTSHSDKRGIAALYGIDFEAWWDAEHNDNFIMPTKAIREWAGKAWVAAARKYLSARTETRPTPNVDAGVDALLAIDATWSVAEARAVVEAILQAAFDVAEGGERT